MRRRFSRTTRSIKSTRYTRAVKRGIAAASPFIDKRLRAHITHMKHLVLRGIGNQEIDNEKTAVDIPDDNSEQFKNAKAECDSPNAMSPDIPSEKLQEIEYDFRAMEALNHYGGFKLIQQVAVITACGFRLPVFVDLVLGYVKYGGWSFLILLYISLLFFATPVAVLEMTLGQFTALPPITLFARMSKACSGIGVTILVFRVSIQMLEFFDARPLHVLLEEITTVIGAGDHKGWKACNKYRNPLCNEMPEDYASEQNGTVGNNRAWRVLGRTDVLSFLPTELFQQMMVNSEMRRFFCLLAICMIAGVVCVKGYDFFSKVSIFMVGTSLAVMMGVFICLAAQFGIRSLFKYTYMDPKFLFSVDAFVVATSVSMQLLSVGEGSWIVLGNVSNFSGLTVLPVVVTACLCMAASFFWTVSGLLTASLLLQKRQTTFGANTPFISKLRNMNYHQHMDMLYLGYTFVIGSGLNIVSVAACALADVPYIVVTYELLIQTVNRMFPVFYRLNQTIVRVCVINTSIGIFIIVKQFIPAEHSFTVNMNSRFRIAPQFAILNMELVMIILFYRDSRVLINLRSMLKPSFELWSVKVEKFYVHVVSLLRFFWRFICPIGLAVCMVAGALIPTSSYSYLTLTPMQIFVIMLSLSSWIVAIHMVVMHLLSSHMMGLFRPHIKWGPTNMNARRRANRYERAAGFS